MHRRSFIGIAGATALGALTGSCRGGAGYDEPSLSRPELLEALGAGGVRAIGTRYRATHPYERDAASIRDAILASRPWRARLAGMATPTIADLVRDDFQRGRIVVVNGWLLSATEARQCALFSLRAA
jgi:hypothetical protein